MPINVRNRQLALRQALILRKKLERLIQPTIERSIRAVAKDAAQAFEKTDELGVRFILPDHRRRIQNQLVPFYRKAAMLFNRRLLDKIAKAYQIPETKELDDDFEAFMQVFAIQSGLNAAEQIATTTGDDIMRIISRGRGDELTTSEIAILINEKVGNSIAPARAAMIASVEVGRATAWGNHQTAILINNRFGLSMTKEWVTNIDARTRRSPPDNFDHVRADRQIRPMDEPFQVSGQKLKHPRDWSSGASPGNLINCRCEQIFHTPDGEI